MAIKLKGRNLEQVSKRLKQIKREAEDTKKAVQEARGLLYGTGSNLNSRQESGGGTS